ncbi:hypothetical protein [Methylorubrum extorquens]|jgi:hypothetical protein|nr:hypothetical protein [Methylorubrum extorquens]UYW33378.1 hypothetical protein OKB92_04615 [Methylorubrum extorquens]
MAGYLARRAYPSTVRPISLSRDLSASTGETAVRPAPLAGFDRTAGE